MFTPLHSLSLTLVFACCIAGGARAAQLAVPEEPPENPWTIRKALVGKLLFFEEQLSSDNTVACATCHRFGSGGADPRTHEHTVYPGGDGLFGTDDDQFGSPGIQLSWPDGDVFPFGHFGARPSVTNRAAPSVIGAAFFDELFLDGRAGDQLVNPEDGTLSASMNGALENQALQPLTSDVEMAHQARTLNDVIQKLGRITPLRLATDLPDDLETALTIWPTYEDLFDYAFGTPEVTAERIAFSLAAYQRTLIADQTPFDAFTAGDPSALTADQQAGLDLFTTSANCSECHPPPLFTDKTFRNVGLRPIAQDRGRQDVTGDPADAGAFRVPGLRNVGLKARFMHTGELSSLDEVMEFYEVHGFFDENKDPEMDEVSLTEAESDLIADFLLNGLTDPRVAAEEPPFDRPTLFSEATADFFTVVAPGVAGTGGHVPELLVSGPPVLGTQGFKLSVVNARGGARAWLVMTDVRENVIPFYGKHYQHFPRPPLPVLFGSDFMLLHDYGPSGRGFGTSHVMTPPRPDLLGLEVHAQWWIEDPQGQAGGFSKSEKIRFTFR